MNRVWREASIGLVSILGLGLGGCGMMNGNFQEKPLFPMVSAGEFRYIEQGPNSSFFEPLEGKKYCKIENKGNVQYVPEQQIKIDQLFYGGRKHGEVNLDLQCGVVNPMPAEDAKKVEEMHRQINPFRLF
jgi:hypothetical protein